nr:hypothetical protein OG781_18335 [Streptomyces sp. NBC_00830]
MVPELIKVLAAAEEASGGPDIARMIGGFTQYGIVGLVVILLILGVLVPRYVMAALTTEKDNWRTAFEQERAAHQELREQLAKAEERGDVATEQAKTLIRLLEEFKRRPEAGPGSA